MKRSPSPNRLILVLCAVVFAVAALTAQIAVLSELPTFAASLQGGVYRIWERAHEALARLSSAVESTGLDASWEQVRAQAPSVPLASSPEREVQAAWRRAQEVGAYRYATDVRQVTRPLPMLTNVGRSSREETLHLEGRINMPDRTMQMTIWNDEGSVLDKRSGLEMRVEGDKAYGRAIGGEWQEMDDFSGLFAPGGDVAGYLAGAKNVRISDFRSPISDFGSDPQSAIENRKSKITRYAFDMDGPSFAAYMRDQLEKHLIEKGELPAGITLDKARVYNDMTGDGEIWINENGLPLRLTLHLEYPEGRYEQQTVHLKTDFSNFAREVLAQGPSPFNNLVARLANVTRDWQRSAKQASAAGILLGLVLLTLTHRQSKKVYGALVIVVIISMVFTPLLQSNQVYAFTQKQAARQAEYEQQQEQQRAEREMQDELTTSRWDPHADPLSVNSDQSSVSNNQYPIPNIPYQTDNTQPTIPNMRQGGDDEDEPEPTSDDDGDGLTYAQEKELGTDPDDDDSDGDQITDDVEVQGFWYNGRQWYSDPRTADTNKDGVIDAHECPQRIREEGELSPTDEICQDTDGDGTPDLFDRDDDNDDVPDRSDMSPYAVMGADDGSPLDGDTPLLLRVDDAEAGKPLFVNFQIRPDNPDRLWYTLNVLDWPSGDEEGQIQRRKDNDSTFKDVAESEGKEAQPRDENGDMRLVPMLEIEMYDTPLPLPLTNPETTVEVKGDISGEVKLEQDGGDIGLEFAFEGAGSYDVKIYAGSCPASGQPLHGFTNITDGDTGVISNEKLVDLADGEHSLTVSDGDKKECADFDNLVNGAYRNQMVDEEWFDPYGISVREKDRDGTLVAYLPLNVVRDETGGARVAFAARMPYRPNEEDWGKTHQVRVVWLVQMLTDRCKVRPDGLSEEEDKTWCDKEENWELDEQSLVHTYQDSWYLTGLSVREDHGLDVGIVFEDPAVEASDNDRMYDHHLWDLAHGLEASFVFARDEDDDGQRDITIDEIQRRWDSDDSTVTDEERWEIPQNALQVHTFSYEHEDYVAHIMMTETVKILDDYFTPYKDQGSDAPTILFAQEHHSRNANLQEDDVVTRNGNNLTVGLDPEDREQEVVALLSWAPYRYRNDKWESYPIAEFWDKLEVRFREIFPPQDEENAEDRARGRVMVARAYYLQLFRGQGNVVQLGGSVEWEANDDQTDSKLAEWVNEIIEGSGSLGRKVKLIATQLANVWLLITGTSAPGTFLQKVGRGAKEWLGAHMMDEKVGGSGAVYTFVNFACIAIIVLTIIYAQKSGNTADILLNVMNGLSLALAIRWAGVITQTLLIKGKAALIALDASGRISTKVGLMGFIISVVITWAAFIVLMSVSGVGWGSLAATAALASTIAATITAAIMLAIVAIPVAGQIIAAVIALIDALIFAICGWTGKAATEEQEGHPICKGISGWVAEGIKWVIYSANIMVDLEDEERLGIQDLDQGLVDPARGLAVNNSLVLSTTVKNTLDLIESPADWKARAYWWQYDDDALKSSTFEYQILQGKQEDIESEEGNIHDDLSRGTMENEWQGDERPFYVVKTASNAVKLANAGINVALEDVYLAEGFAVPAQECWAVPTIGPPCFFYPCVPICYIRDFKATVHPNVGKYLKYDVFPATIDEFYALVEKDGGYALAWDQEGDLTFPRLKDADGDDLLNKADGGSDPDDSQWDTDFDGLSDLYEAQNGSDPRQRDVDGDGLSDYDEARLGTNPYRADSDSDGLLDGEEVFHQDAGGNWVGGWEFVYGFDADGNPLRTWVSSDPLEVDVDDDGLTDFQEKTFGFHPRVETDADILTLESRVHEVDAPWVLLHLDQDEGATTFSDSSGYDNHATCSGNACPEAGVSGKYSRAVEFGAGDTATIEDAGTGDLRQLTVAAWVRLNSLPSGKIMRFVTMGDEKAVVRYDGASGPGQLHFYVRIGGSLRSIRVNNALKLNGFQHVAGTYDGGTMRLYLDGNQVGSLNVQGTVGGGARVGMSHPTESLDGRLDDVAIYGRALSAGELQSLMAGKYNPNDHVVKPGDTLRYEATVKNELKGRYAEGLLSTDFPGAMDSDVHPETFVLDPQEEEVMDGDVTVKDDAATGVYTLTQVAGALITDWREESDFAELQLHLDEEEGATTFEDSSGTQPRHDGECSGNNCPTAQVQGAHGYGLQFDGVDDYVTVDDDNIDDMQELTITAWLKMNAQPEPNEIMRFVTLGNEKAVLRYYAASDGAMHIHFYMKIGGSLHSIQAKRKLETDRFYHVVGTYGGNTMRLYQDGQQIGSLEVKGEVGGGSRVLLSHVTETLDGVLDEVILYPRALSADEVQALYGKPVLRLRFDESSGAQEFKDSSGFGQRTECYEPKTCPGAGEAGISGKALKFWDEDYVEVYKNSNLYLDEGRFTLSAWVYPMNRDSARDNHWQGVLGANSGEKNAYPTLQVKGRQVRVGFGTDSDWKEYVTGDVLTRNAWNLVVATYTTFDQDGDGQDDRGELTVYVNGLQVGSSTLGEAYRPARVTEKAYSHFSIGRSTLRGRMYVHGTWVENENDGAGLAELCLEGQYDIVWHKEGVDDDDGKGEWYDIDWMSSASNQVYIRLWEDDGGGTCEESDSDDILLGRQFKNTDPSKQTESIHYDADTIGTLYLGHGDKWAWYVDAIPFHGRMDEVAIYKRALPAEEVWELYEAGAKVLHLDLDDAPGSTTFEDETGQNDATCAGEACPAAGATGRLNQAAQFDGAQDYLEVPHNRELNGDQALTLAAWVKLEDPNAHQKVMGKAHPGGCPPGANQVALYVAGDYGWQCVVKDIGNYPNPDAIGLPNDTISSVRVGDNVKATLCQAANYGGVCQTFVSNDPNLTDNDVGNDTVSSVKVESLPCIPSANQIALFEAADYDGRWPCVVKGIGSYPDPNAIGLSNDSISSIKVGTSVKATLCQAANYGGTCEAFGGADRNLGDNGVGNDTVSSVKVEWRASLCLPNDDEVALFEAGNYLGDCVVKGIGSYPNPNAIGLDNDSISSIKVGALVKATLCQAANYGGRCEAFRDNDPNLTDNDVGNDTVSSAQVKRYGLGYVLGVGNGHLYPEVWDEAGDQYTGQWGTIPADTWAHLALTWRSGGDMIGYVNGQEVGRTTASSRPIGVNDLPFRIGAAPWDTTQYNVNGRVDQVVMYRQALSADQIRELYESAPLFMMHFDEDEGATRFHDDSGQGRHGTCSGDACPTAGVKGQIGLAVEYDGVDDTVNLGSGISSGFDELTVMGWVKGSQGTLVSRGAGNQAGHFQLDFNDRFEFTAAGGRDSHVLFNTIPEDHWAHVAATYDGSEMKVYVNGSLGAYEPSPYPGDPLLEDATMWLHLDETGTPTRFEDASGNGNHGTCTGNQCPGTVGTGKYKRAADFDGTNDTVTVAGANTNALQRLTVAAWVKLDSLPSRVMRFVTLFDEKAVLRYDGSQYGGPGQLHFYMKIDGSLRGIRVNNALKQGVFQHVAGTYDGSTMRLYLDGEQVGSLDIAGTVGGGTGLRLSHPGGDASLDGLLDEVALFDRALTPQEIEALAGGEPTASSPASGAIPSSSAQTVIGRAQAGGSPFNGRVDEVSIYDRALSARQIRNIFLYQAKWVEDRESHDITVDDDEPASTLESDAGYLPNRDTVMHVSTTDPTSRAAVAELGVSTDGGQSYTWLPAPPCRDADIGTAWCPTFDPRDFVGEGRYTLTTRAVDAVGNTESSRETYTILVDGAAPQVSTTMQDGRISRPDRHPAIETAWTVPLDGTVNDPNLSSGDPGSDVASDGVHVTLLDTEGNPAGQGRQAATLNGNHWTADYDFYEADATGTYTVSVAARDKVGNSSTTNLLTVRLDTTAPRASLDSAGDVTDTITTTLTLRGTVTDTGSVAAGVARSEISFQPVEQIHVVEDALLLMHLDEEQGATRFADDSIHGHPGTCSGQSCPTAGQSGKVDQAVRFDGSNDYIEVAHNDRLNAGKDLTLAAWVKLNSPGVDQKVMGKTPIGSGYLLGVAYSRLYPEVWDNAGTKFSGLWGSGSIPSLEWTHLALTWHSGGDMIGYINGQEVGRIAASANPIGANTNPLRIGAAPWNVNSFQVRGLIDELAVYDRALSADEVKTLYEAGNVSWADTTLAASGEGIVETTWSHPVPDNLDGIYRINVRGTDTLGNRATRPAWDVWRGQIDTLAPRVELSVTIQYTLPVQTRYECWAQDFNLYERLSDEDDVPAEYDFQCPCEDLAPADTTYERVFYHEVSAWYRTVISDTTRPYELTASCTVPGVPTYPVTMKACDVHGNCTEKQVDAPAGAQGDEKIAQGDEKIANELVTLSPPHPLTLSPDLEIDISPTVLTTTHRLSYGRVALTGNVTDTASVDKVIVKVEDEGWRRASVEGDGWRLPWYLDEEPDGKQYTVSARASTVAGETAQVTETVTVDLQSPASVTVTLTTDGTVLEPGDTVREAAPTLTIEWTASSDNSGLDDYLVGWTVGQVDNLSNYDPAGQRRHDYVASEPQALTAVVVSQDQLGNQTRQEEGPIYVDAPTTPDYIPFPDSTGVDVYHGWMGSGCSHVGTDRRVSQHAQGSASLDAEQKFYATWDDEALRLVWTGARWNADGDLFIYLDFQAGGTNTAYNPYGDGNTVYLPGHDTASPMEADYLIWVQDAETADLLRWDGASWVGQDGILSNDEYRFDAGLNDGHTDLYIPFDLIGVTDPAATALDLVAFASEQDGLRLWATAPSDNPVNSPRVVNTDSHAGSNHEFALQHQYHWDSLGDSVCPNGGPTQYAEQSGIARNTQPGTRTATAQAVPVVTIISPLPGSQVETCQVNLAGTIVSAVPLTSAQVEVTADGQSRTDNLTVTGFAPSFAFNQNVAIFDGANTLVVKATNAFGEGSASVNVVCTPSGPGVQYLDADLQVDISADPVGTTYSFIGDDLFWLWESLFDPDRPADLSESFTFMDVDHPPLGDGQEVLYTVHYRNQGTSTAAGVRLDVSAWFALRLPDGQHLPTQYHDHQVVVLGDIGPGDEGVATFRGVVNLAATRQEYYEPCLALFPNTPEVCDPYLQWASVTALVYDNAHPETGLPLDWIWVDHKVDSTAPEFFGIVWPEYLVSAGVNTVRGYAYDASGVPQITLEIQSPLGGTTMLNCPDATPQDGQWSCDWDVTATNGGVTPADGAEFLVRLQATDGFGQVSEWTHWQTFVVDTEPPTVTLDAAASGAADGSLVNTGAYRLVGDVSDNHGLGDVEVCIDGDCAQAGVQLQVAPANVYDDEPAAPLAIGASTACGVNSIMRTFEVTDSLTVGEISFGFNVTHTRRNDIVAVLASPQGTEVQVIFPKMGTPSRFQNYDVLLDDAVPSGLHDYKGDDNPAAPYYDRSARPHEPLQAFQGEDAAGTWTLTICDANPLLDDGTYNRSRLVLWPQNTAAQTGRWFYTAPGVEALDAVEQTIIVTGIDLVGNRTAEPLAMLSTGEAPLLSIASTSLVLSITVDNVAPAVTAELAVTSLSPLETPPVVLSGTASDGGGVAYIHVLVQTPGGQFYTERTARDGEAWEYTPSQLAGSGTYYLWVEAEDRAGNVAAVGPFALEVAGCGTADLTTTFVTAELAEGSIWDILLTAQVRNDGGESVPAGLPVSFYQGDPNEGGMLIGTAVTADALDPGESEEVSVIWTPEEPVAGDYEIHITTNDAGGYEGEGFYALCAQPERVEQAVSVLDVRLVESWNLMSTYVNPFTTDTSVVQGPIAGKYVVIQGFDGGAQSYYPDLPPEVNTLKDMDAEHGYWVKVKPEGDEATISGHPFDSAQGGLLSLNQDEDDEELVITLRVVGEQFAEDRAIELNAGWNLVSYLPRDPLAVPDALQSIDGLYMVVLGYDQGALSYYPDIDPSFNTLHTMESLLGYWIHMAQPATLQYPTTGGGGLMTAEESAAVVSIRQAERAAGVTPTHTWVNFYGATSLPVGTMVYAIDPDGVTCGATVITTEGQYGLLACYGDDPTTPEDEGARPGDIIQLVVDGQTLNRGMCTVQGDLHWVPLGPASHQWQVFLPLVQLR